VPISRTWTLSGGRQTVACTGSRTANHFVELAADAAAPAANQAVIYSKDNGAGKTQLVARFATGAVQQIAIQP
jgi:tRNA A37 threonylcarbamoyladenosine biosynthesis protein TsaE